MDQIVVFVNKLGKPSTVKARAFYMSDGHTPRKAFQGLEVLYSGDESGYEQQEAEAPKKGRGRKPAIQE